MTTATPQTTASGADNARAKLATIEAIYELERLAILWSSGGELFAMSPDASELLTDNGINYDKDDLEPDHLRDVAWDACRNQCLGVDYSATWSAGCDFNGEPDSFKVWLSVGGPSCWITGDFGPHGLVDSDSLRFWFSWASASDFLLLTDAEREALNWFVNEVCV